MASCLFVNHREKQCGVYQFGYSTYKNISDIATYIEANSQLDVNIYSPEHRIILFNYYPSTMPFVTQAFLSKLRQSHKIGAIFHEVPITGFDFYVHIDPTIGEHDNHYTVGRPLLEYSGEYPKNDVVTFGSFGFGFGNKGWKLFIEKVQESYDEAIINLRIPSATFGDSNGFNAKAIGEACKKFIYKSGIQLNLSYDFLDQDALLTFLAGNDMNVFLYDNEPGRGLASVTDFALSVRRPVAITDTNRFNHLRGEKSICIEHNTLSSILELGTEPLEKFYAQFSKENLVRDYEKIFKKVQ